MTEQLSAFVPDGVDPSDEEEARRAAIDCLNAVGQLLETAQLSRRGTVVTEKAILRCLYDLDRAVADSGHYRLCNLPLPSPHSAPYTCAANLAMKVRAGWTRAVAKWKKNADAPAEGWFCLWQLYEEHFGDSVGPTWADAVSSTTKCDADEKGLINSWEIRIPDEAAEYQWHFKAWPFVCEQLADFSLADVTALLEILELGGGAREDSRDLHTGGMTSQLDQAVETALTAYEDGYRIIATWFNRAFSAWKVGLRIKADQPLLDVTLDDCRRRLSNALLAIRPLCPDLGPDDRLCPWAVGYLRGDRDQPGEQPGGIGLIENPFSPWGSADAVENVVGVKHGYGWTDAGQWRTYVVEPMEQNARSWRKWLSQFHSSNAGAGDTSLQETSTLLEVKRNDLQPVVQSTSGSVLLFGRADKPIVRGNENSILTSAQYDVIFALCKAGEKGLSKDKLDKNSKHGDARKILRRLSQRDRDWTSVISFPGTTGKGYRIL